MFKIYFGISSFVAIGLKDTFWAHNKLRAPHQVSNVTQTSEILLEFRDT